MPKGEAGCAQLDPNLVASRTPLQGAAGAGGSHRKAPTGRAAKTSQVDGELRCLEN
jgi:hypothetical protein